MKQYLHFPFKPIFCFLFCVLYFTAARSQAPQQMNYQTVVRNAMGQPESKTPVTFRFTICESSEEGQPVFTETQSTTTNPFGLATLKIGSVKDLKAVNWSMGSKFLRVDVDVNNTGSFTSMGAAQLLSVPYAFYADKAGSMDDVADNSPTHQHRASSTPALIWNCANQTLTLGNQSVRIVNCDGTFGATGATGAQGATGPTGPTGATGVAGADGAIGATGPTGPTGANGAKGIDGQNGADGATGATGSDGSDGANGATGATGADGSDGADGATGATGADGNDGADGATGATGADGADGQNGADGPTGPTGADGSNGTDGDDGADGADGATGPTGADGTNGEDGATGATGPLVPGTNGQTLRHDGTGWVADSYLYNTGTQVAVGTTSPTTPFEVATSVGFTGPETVDQSVAVNNVNSCNPLIWQSFTPGFTGYLNSVDIFAFDLSPDDVTMNIYSGEGNGGTLLATTTNVVPGGFVFTTVTFTFATPAFVTAGQVYTFEASLPAGIYALCHLFNTSDVYPGGRYIFNPSYDMKFTTRVTPQGSAPEVTLVATQGKVGIGTASPETKLHVEGDIRINDGTAAPGYVLTAVDGSGTAQWQLGSGGATGPTGPTGANGTNGAQGPTGAAGTNGTNGAQGPTGATGTNGTNGAQGPTGATGTNGTNGAQGPTGATGTNGTNGAQGPTGATGTNGTNGAQGPTGATGPVGCATNNFLIKSNGSSAVCSIIQDNGTNVGIGVSPGFKLDAQSADASRTGNFINTNSVGDGVWGFNSAALGVGNGAGVVGITNQSGALSAGVWGDNANVNGIGVVGVANSVASTTFSGGAGGAFHGLFTGVLARSTTVNTGQAIYCEQFSDVVRVGFFNGTFYKINGAGTVSTIVKDLSGVDVVMHAPETPEVYFQDYGEAKLVNGKAHIELDPIFAKNITVNTKHPLRAFVQLEGDCNGVYITNKTATGFDVTELNNGTSNVAFQWTVTCNRADQILNSGRLSRFADLRFELSEPPIATEGKGVRRTDLKQTK